MNEILLFSAGLDSFPAWHYLGQPPALYFDLGHRYAAQERAAIEALTQATGIEVTISDELRLGAWEAEDAIIPMRNVHLAMLAANRAETVWCIGVKGTTPSTKAGSHSPTCPRSSPACPGTRCGSTARSGT